MTPARILFVEDDVNLGFVIRDNLERASFAVTHCLTGPDAWATFQAEPFDVCVLDVMLAQPVPRSPDQPHDLATPTDGFMLARQIRTVNADVPILFLSALADRDDRLRGLRLGADDYLTKPFSIDELILKLHVFLRRARFVAPSMATDLSDSVTPSGAPTHEMRLNYRNLTLHLNGRTQTLTHREADVLAYLINRPNALVRRDELLRAVWGDDDYFMGRSLDVFISRLRKRLADDPTIRIENVHGVGFIFRRELA